MIRKFIGPGYIRLGPITAGPFGIGCLPYVLLALVVIVGLVVVFV